MNVSIVILPNPILLSPRAHFPQGPLYVSRSLRLAGYQVKIVDLRDKDDIKPEYIPKCDVIMTGATSGEINWAEQVRDIASRKGAMTMIGGPHATFMPDDCKKWDFIVVGDGEEAAVDALRNKSPGVYSHPIKSIAGYYPDWAIVGNKGFSRELFTGAGYGKGPYAAGICTSRGCPYRCSYCRSERGIVRFRPIGDVYRELYVLKSIYGINHFRLYDDCMCINKERTKELFHMFSRFDMKWRAHTRANIFDDETARMAKDCGCTEMGFGFETATDSVLKKIHKQETVDQYREAVRICKKYGIRCKAFWMVGLSGQGWKEIDDIKRFMLEEQPDRWICSLLSPYPGSDIWSHPENYDATWIESDLSKYWNFSSEPNIEYKNNSRSQIKLQYEHLVQWLSKEFPR